VNIDSFTAGLYVIAFGFIALPALSFVVPKSFWRARDERVRRKAARWQDVSIPSRITFIILVELVWAFVLGMYLIDGPMRPSLVEDLQTGKLSVTEISAIEFVETHMGFPFTNYTQRVSTSNQSDMLDKLVYHLKSGLNPESVNRNHPGTVCPNNHQIVLHLKNGDYYSIGYSVHHNWDGEDYDYASLRVGPRVPPKSAGVRTYETRSIVTFFEQYDPWYPKKQPNKNSKELPK
jgi:hypothetical protein